MWEKWTEDQRTKEKGHGWGGGMSESGKKHKDKRTMGKYPSLGNHYDHKDNRIIRNEMEC